MAYSEARNEQFAALGRERLVVGDVFDFPVAVVPIKTKGRWYGAISRAVVARGLVLPELSLGGVEHRKVDDVRSYIFVALWSDENKYSGALIYNCTRACVGLAARLRLQQLAFPLLGGNQGHRFVGAMEQAVDEAMDDCADAEIEMPEVVFVTDREQA